MTGVLARADEFHHMKIESGRFFTDEEVARAALVAVLSHKLAAELSGGVDPGLIVGRDVRINGVAAQVLGVLAPYEGEREYDAYIPFAAVRRVFPPSGSPRPATILLRAASIESVDALKSAAEDWAARRYVGGIRKLEIETQRTRISQAMQGVLVFKIFMGALTGISLLVGGIGIMNVLLASVTERTREIGIRKAVGARGRDVLMQFLAESVAISGAGSAVGVLLGLATAFGVTAIIRARANAEFFQAGFSWTTIAVAVASAVLVGLILGPIPLAAPRA